MKSVKELQDEVANWDIHSHVYESSNKFEKWIAEKRIKLIKEMVDSKGTNLNILDAGCGDGFFIKALIENQNLVNADISVKRLCRCREKDKNAKLIASDCYDLSFKDNAFDVVVCSETLEHVSHPGEIVKELVRVTKKNGSIIISSPNENNWRLGRLFTFRFPIAHKDHIYKITPKKLNKFFNDKPVVSRTIPSLPYIFSLIHIHEYIKS